MYAFQCSKCRLFNPPGSKFCQKCGGQVIDLWARKLDIGFKGFVVMFSVILLMLLVGTIALVILLAK